MEETVTKEKLYAFITVLLFIATGCINKADNSAKKVNPKDGMTLMLIPAGEFEMGSDDGYRDEEPIHTVYLDSFWMYQTEVTNTMYAAFLNEMGNQTEDGVTWLQADSSYAHIFQSGSKWIADSDYSDHPVMEVSWYGAQAYCEWAGGGLPTEAQWEKAARGGLEGTKFLWGDESPVCTLGEPNGAQHISCGGRTLPVGSFAPNGFGLYDMGGNVWEWVADWFDEKYYASSTYENPTGPESGEFRVLRGGSWGFNANHLRVADRITRTPDVTDGKFGFRCVFPYQP
jgi:formylglycine-generating enzyme required for sulfatase activity